MTVSSGPFLPAVDRAAFAVAFADRLRERGVRVGLTATQDFVNALSLPGPLTRTDLYWRARVTLVRHRRDLMVFDEVFAAVFGDAVLALDPHARRDPLAPAADSSAHAPRSGPVHASTGRSELPWATLPTSRPAEQDPTDDRFPTVPLRLPSTLGGSLDTPFGQLDPREAALLGRWLEAALREWPTRRTRTYAIRPGGPGISLRATLTRARRTGWEPVRLVRTGPTRRPRRVVVLCDVSRSMQAQAVPCLHLMRALALRADAEVFAFATSPTRLTTVLAHRSAEEAFDLATRRVTDRFGGTRIAHCLSALLASHHGGTLRGAVVLICSDGWDGDPPDHLARAMARLRRRAHLVVWLNPRAAAPGFEPRTTTLAAALPYTDLHLPAAGFSDLLRVSGDIAAVARRRTPSSTRSHEWRAGTVPPSPRPPASSPATHGVC